MSRRGEKEMTWKGVQPPKMLSSSGEMRCRVSIASSTLSQGLYWARRVGSSKSGLEARTISERLTGRRGTGLLP